MEKKKLFRMALCVLLLAIGFAVSAELINPGFEKISSAEEKEGLIQGLRNTGWKFDEPLVFPEGWKTNSGAFRNGEYRLITDSSQSHGGNNCIYLKGHFMHTDSIDVTAGDDVEISFYVQDKDKKAAGVCLYFYYKDEKNRDIFTGSSQFTVKTELEWIKRSGTIKIPEESHGKRVNSIIVALFSSTGAYFDDVEISHTRTAAWLNFQDAHAEGNKKLTQGNFAGAREDFNVGLGLTKDNNERIDALLKVAETYIKEKNYAQAVETFNTILAKEKPDDNMKVDVHLKIADTYIKERNYDKAIDAFEAVLKMKEAGPIDRVFTQFKIGDTCVTGKDYVKAREAYARILSMPATNLVDKFEANKRIGDTYRTEKNYEKAREAYKSALNVADVNPYSKASLLHVIAGTYEAEERYEEARKVYARILDTGLEAWTYIKPAYIKIGETYRKEKNFVKEREYYGEMAIWAKEKPSSIGQLTYGITAQADVLRLTGDSYWEEGDKETAKEYYLQFLETGKVKLADNLVKQVEERVGKNRPSEYLRQADGLFFERDYEKAIEEYAKVLQSDESSLRQKTVAYIKTGDIYLAQEDYNKARAEYLKVSRMKDATGIEKARAQMLIGDSYSIEQNYKQARNEYAKVFGMKGIGSPEKIEAQARIAEMYRAEYNYTQARVEYGKMLKMEGLSDLQKEETRQRMLSIYR